MNEAQAKEAISARWGAAWGTSQPGVPFALGNEAATPPAAASLFAALSFGPLVERQLTMGPPPSRRFEYRGTITVRLFGPLDAGESQLATLADAARAALASQTIPAPGTLIGMSSSSVTAKQGSWWTNTIAVAFRFYDTH